MALVTSAIPALAVPVSLCCPSELINLAVALQPLLLSSHTPSTRRARGGEAPHPTSSATHSCSLAMHCAPLVVIQLSVCPADRPTTTVVEAVVEALVLVRRSTGAVAASAVLALPSAAVVVPA